MSNLNRALPSVILMVAHMSRSGTTSMLWACSRATGRALLETWVVWGGFCSKGSGLISWGCTPRFRGGFIILKSPLRDVGPYEDHIGVVLGYPC